VCPVYWNNVNFRILSQTGPVYATSWKQLEHVAATTTHSRHYTVHTD